MRSLRPFAGVAVLMVGSGLAAQSPLTTLFAANNGGVVGGAVFFDLTVSNLDVTVGALEVNCSSAPGVAASADIYLIAGGTYAGNERDPAPWGSPAATAAFVTEALDAPTFAPLENSIVLSASTTYGVAVVANGFSHGYTDGNGTPGMSGSGTNQTYSTPDLTLAAGSAMNLPFQPGGSVFDPRVANLSIHYALGGGPVVSAYSRVYGEGCYYVPVSVYEDFVPGTLDLVGVAGTTIESIEFTPNGVGGYSLAAGSGLWSDSTGNIAPGAVPASSPLAIGDDEIVTIDLAALGLGLVNVPGAVGVHDFLFICSNGFLSIDPAIDTDFTPSSVELLANAMRWALAWNDFEPNAQGSVHFDSDGTNCYVTYHDVPAWGQAGSSSNSCQIAFFPGGVIEYRWEVMDIGHNPYTIGFSTGRGAANPGNLDLDVAAALGFDTGPGSVPPGLAANARPLVGTTVDLVVSNIPVRTLLGAVIISLVQDIPGTDLGFLGMPGCSAHIDPFNNVTLGAFSPGGSSNSSSFAVVPGFSGVEVFFQAGLFVPGVNLQNLLVSNALTLRIGNI